MRAFVLRARSAPTDSQLFLASVGQEAHTEILAHTLMNTIFVAQSHRNDVVVYLVQKVPMIFPALFASILEIFAILVVFTSKLCSLKLPKP